jgi:predicted PurR-regulated permease PerM
MFLIPLACLLVAVAVLFGKTNFTRTAAKITLIGLIIFMIVPASVTLSDMVYRTQADKVDQTIEECNDLELVGDSDKGLLNELTTITTNTVDKITSFLDNLLESLAVMIVTSCIIPLLVFAFLIWLVKIIFSANAPVIDSSVIDAITARR